MTALLTVAACGGTASTRTDYANPGLLAKGADLDVDGANQIIIDTRSAAKYAEGHIENAINLSPGALDSATDAGPTFDLRPAAEAAAILGAAGVSSAATIIVYGSDVDAATGRMFWDLEYLGAANVRILDGGYAKWVADGRPVVTTPTTAPQAVFTASVDDRRVATKEYILAHYADTANYAIIDSRNAEDGADPVWGPGYTSRHIPNAVNILVDEFLNTDKTVKSYADLTTLLDAKGVTGGKTVITHCYVGWRSGQEYFILRLMGFQARNYEGSWVEWSADPSLPTEP
ncbi:MAG: sulfurtransferase [Nitrospinae bacterium]|nr:sulfurtransferase [Nitrospinota bacterium]